MKVGDNIIRRLRVGSNDILIARSSDKIYYPDSGGAAAVWRGPIAFYNQAGSNPQWVKAPMDSSSHFYMMRNSIISLRVNYGMDLGETVFNDVHQFVVPKMVTGTYKVSWRALLRPSQANWNLYLQRCTAWIGAGATGLDADMNFSYMISISSSGGLPYTYQFYDGSWTFTKSQTNYAEIIYPLCVNTGTTGSQTGPPDIQGFSYGIRKIA